jgi:hypothetical protein
MDLTLPLFAVVSAAILCALCLIVLEHQNGRTRRLSRSWSDRVRSLPNPSLPASPDSGSVKDTRAA